MGRMLLVLEVLHLLIRRWRTLWARIATRLLILGGVILKRCLLMLLGKFVLCLELEVC